MAVAEGWRGCHSPIHMYDITRDTTRFRSPDTASSRFLKESSWFLQRDRIFQKHNRKALSDPCSVISRHGTRRIIYLPQKSVQLMRGLMWTRVSHWVGAINAGDLPSYWNTSFGLKGAQQTLKLLRWRNKRIGDRRSPGAAPRQQTPPEWFILATTRY